MKTLLKILASALFITILFSSCSQPAAPAAGTDLFTYSVDGSDLSLKADVTYMGDDGLVRLEDQSLPWSVTVDVPKGSLNDVYLKAEVPQAEVFKAYVTGVTDAVPVSQTLKDSDADFTGSGVTAGDVVYKNQSSLEYTRVRTVDGSDTLSLDLDFLTVGNETYYLYKTKTLTAEISLNGETLESDSVESERVLSCLVQSTLDM